MAQQRPRTRMVRKESFAHSPAVTQADVLRQALEWFTRNNSFADLRLHGNVGWTAPRLIALTVLWVWSDQTTLVGAFSQASQLGQAIFGTTAVTSYQGLIGALRSYGAQLLPQLWSLFHRQMERSAGPHWRIGKWLALAVDGSRVTTPRTVSNEQSFAIKNYGRGARTRSKTKWKNKKRRSKRLCEPVKPQIWLTLIWHMGLKMPWCWKTGPSTACERHHLQDMLETQVFPSDTLFCGDAGFVGYPLWTALLDRGRHFLIRVGSNVRLLRNLGHARQRNGLVYLWPDTARRQKQPPLQLRLIEFQGPRGKVYLVTSILSQRELSLNQAMQLYRLRWGVELQFRALKQTFGRRKLRSRTAQNALVELDWSLLGLWLIQLFAVKEQIKVHGPPSQSSVALALHAVRDAMRNWTSVMEAGNQFTDRLRIAIQDAYCRTRPKRARYRPSYKDKPCATKPRLIQASSVQRKAYQGLRAAA
jgi:hypothetical protein